MSYIKCKDVQAHQVNTRYVIGGKPTASFCLFWLSCGGLFKCYSILYCSIERWRPSHFKCQLKMLAGAFAIVKLQ